jgi:hypothetical protein
MLNEERYRREKNGGRDWYFADTLEHCGANARGCEREVNCRDGSVTSQNS